MPANAESLMNQGEFHSRVPPSKPLQTGGHKPGVKVGNDAYPEFHAETYPPGTAPPERSFQPRRPATGEEVSTQSVENPNTDTDTDTDATLPPGATSADVHTGFGKPIQGQENREVHGKRANKREGAGLEGVGAGVGEYVPGGGERDHARGRGKASAEYPSATERLPEGAEMVAAERA